MTWMKRQLKIPPEHREPWGGIFSVERRAEMTWTKSMIATILKDPHGVTGTVSHALAIQLMVRALRIHHPEIFVSKFFNDVEVRLRRRGHWTSERELKAMAGALHKYTDLLEKIAEKKRSQRETESEIIEVPKTLPPVSNTYNEDDDNILEA